ncbi:NUDIX domain-containing protein [Fluviispira multicolorata]|uniref:NUDIX domain-containing protein n=1 Tax=Fluviispira multicolorata TaxID=2654512 RepID=A0A833N4M8_9BACT|nr:NUDIX domain-containing protein [Fluviispira multicolorata]KAB8028459.1 NUDIX domain-containing protein [Fluviispira multicolorata]
MFRENVAALIKCNNMYLACNRTDHNTWQNVQGGIEESDKSPLHAIIRETIEELGVEEADFKIIYKSKFWRRYYFPKEILNRERFKGNVGQEQLWFLIELKDINKIDLKKSVGEFKKVKLVNIEDFVDIYSQWKIASFYDFCRELNLLKI